MAKQNEQQNNVNVEEAKAKLEKLAEQIKGEHGRVVTTYRKSLDHAKKVGELLSKARDLCHTSSTPWRTWIQQNTGLSLPTVNGYIKVYEGWEKIEAAGDKINTIKGAIDLLKPARPQPATSRKKGTRISRSKLTEVATRRGLTADAVLGILTDLGLKVEVEDDQKPNAA